MAELEPRDVTLAEIYDCYTSAVLIELEDAGFCPKGEGGRFVEAHDLTFAGDFPLNTHGGMLSFGQPGLGGGMTLVELADGVSLEDIAGKTQGSYKVALKAA
jgi:acetyl-CoA acetyltransferase